LDRTDSAVLHAPRRHGKNETRFGFGTAPLSGLYRLAAPSTPQAVVDDVLDRKAAGEMITVPLIKREINEAKATCAEQEPEAAKKAAMQKPRDPADACVDNVRSVVLTHASPLSRKDRDRLFGALRDTIDDIEADLAASYSATHAGEPIKGHGRLPISAAISARKSF
jgi:hypothetical protein